MEDALLVGPPLDDVFEGFEGLSSDYVYGLDRDWLGSLGPLNHALEHGLFLLHGNAQIFAMPFPREPFVFDLTPGGAKRWAAGKKTKRFAKEFQVSCNLDFRAHLAQAAECPPPRAVGLPERSVAGLLARVTVP